MIVLTELKTSHKSGLRNFFFFKCLTDEIEAYKGSVSDFTDCLWLVLLFTEIVNVTSPVGKEKTNVWVTVYDKQTED